jgi:putative ABC transport system ATP-binding protein
MLTNSISPLIVTQNLSKTFNKSKTNEVKAVENINLQILANESILLQGSSGSGKSTLLAMLGCLLKPSSGEYLCMGEKVSRWSESFLANYRQKHIGIVFQQFQLIQGLTVFDNLAIPLLPLSLNRKEITKAVEKAAQDAEIAHKLTFKVDVLSGGEMQRVAIGRALVNNPTLLLADEPTAHLDTETAKTILKLFAKLKENGKTLIITSHDSLVKQSTLFDRVIEMQDGKMQEKK